MTEGNGNGGSGGGLVFTAGGRVRLAGISARAWEHPADRAAMAGLRKVPAFDTVLRKLIGFLDERALRFLFLGSAVRANERQFAEVHRILVECCEVLDVSPPELYVSQTPIVNAGAIGVDRPFIVLNSGTVDFLTPDELRYVIGHELGHILSDHVLYKTMLRLMLNLVVLRMGMPMFALLGVVVALLEWDRKSELSGDRAGLLTLQDPAIAYRVHMKLAGGARTEQMSVDEFIAQAREYEAGGDVVDGIFKLLNLLGRSHPFHVLRLNELQTWVDTGAYKAVLDGGYGRREDDSSASIFDEVRAGAQSYRESYQRSNDPLRRFFGDVGDTVVSAGERAVEGLRDLFGRSRE